MSTFINDVIGFIIRRISEESHYKIIFKGSVVMLTLTLLLFNQFGSIANLEKSALTHKFTAEMNLGYIIDDIDKHSCDIKNKTYVDCQLAKVQLSTLELSIELILMLIKYSIYIGFSMLALAVIGYISSMIDSFKKETKQIVEPEKKCGL